MDKCGTCEHFTDGGDWNLCCNIPHPTPKEKEIREAEKVTNEVGGRL